MMQTIPRELADVLSDFCQARRSGSVTLHIKDGRVLEIHETPLTKVTKVDRLSK